jgi:formate-dependent nitrite reductase membrane component NrfD
VYPGFLFGVLESVPFWNTPALPPLFFLSGLDTGIAILALISLLTPEHLGIEGFHLLALGDVVLIVLLFIMLGAYLEIARHAGVTASASIYLLKNPFFIGGVIFIGLLFPLVMLVYSLFISHDIAIYILTGIAGAFVLAGGLFLRYSMIRAGVRVSVR